MSSLLPPTHSRDISDSGVSVPGSVLYWVLRDLFGRSVCLLVTKKKERKKKEKKKQHSNRRTVSLNGTGNKAASSQKRSRLSLCGAVALFWQDKTHTGVDSSPPSSSSSALLLSSPPPPLLLLLRAQPSCFSSTLRARTVPPRHTAPPWRHGWWVAGREGGGRRGGHCPVMIHSLLSRHYFLLFLSSHAPCSVNNI